MQENALIKENTSKLVEQVKKEEECKEYQVDRRMINQFLVNYLDKSSNRQTQDHMLQALSKILVFTEDEKKKLGLIP